MGMDIVAKRSDGHGRAEEFALGEVFDHVVLEGIGRYGRAVLAEHHARHRVDHHADLLTFDEVFVVCHRRGVASQTEGNPRLLIGLGQYRAPFLHGCIVDGVELHVAVDDPGAASRHGPLDR